MFENTMIKSFLVSCSMEHAAYNLYDLKYNIILCETKSHIEANQKPIKPQKQNSYIESKQSRIPSNKSHTKPNQM